MSTAALAMLAIAVVPVHLAFAEENPGGDSALAAAGTTTPGSEMLAFDCQWFARSFDAPFTAAACQSPAARHSAGLPFSFMYGGQPSARLIGSWNVTVRVESLDPTKTRRILTLTDPDTGLEVRAEATCYTDTGGIDCTL